MSKILNINDDIKINKNNVQTPYTILSKESGSGTKVSFTYVGSVYAKCVPIWIERNGHPVQINIAIHNYKISKVAHIMSTSDVTDVSAEVSDDAKTITITCGSWAKATLVDFNDNGNNQWS